MSSRSSAPEGPWGVEGLRAKRSQKQREKGAQRRAGDGHLKRGQQRRKDAGSIAPFRRQHGGEQVRQVAPAGPEQGGGAAGEPRRREKEQAEEQHGDKPLSGRAAHDCASCPPYTAGRISRAGVSAGPSNTTAPPFSPMSRLENSCDSSKLWLFMRMVSCWSR